MADHPIAIRRAPAPSSWYVASIFLSAFLLFLVQPMVARMLLPRFGGSPAVWSTALVFFQLALLLGYAYAHWSAVRLTPQRQAVVHAMLVGLAVVLLPPRLPASTPAPEAWPVPALLGALALVVGAPFLVLATNSSLVQHWYAQRPAESRADPYALYAASNAGSLLALLAYPFVVEPLVGVGAQAWLWAAGYLGFAVLTAVLLRRASSEQPPERPADASDAAWRGLWRARQAVDDDAPGRRLLWVTRSAVASSLLVATTMAITTDIAAVPLFWVIPLALYLVTFIAAFGATRRVPRGLVVAATVIGVTASLVSLALPRAALWAVLLPPLFTLLAGALLCHGDLAAERPPARYLTGYYLWISVGGALGGAFGSLVAPVAFDTVLEYPLTLVALAWLVSVPPGVRPTWPRWPGLRLDALVPPLAMTALAAVTAYQLAFGPASNRANWLLVAPLILLYGALLAAKPGRFGLAAALFALVYTTGFAASLRVVDQDRSFFGVLRIRQTARERVMLHGTTMHGTQRLDPAESRMPGGYYHPEGPLGSLVAGAADGARIGVIGLGTGALASLARPGQHLTYFEIDPLVERMARAHFTYLADSPAAVDVVIGDGRLALAAEPDGDLDLLVVDAFSSDAVPVHLLTAEAMDLYRRKVSADGLVVLHISNRHLDLTRVARGYGRARGLAIGHSLWEPPAAAASEGASWTEAVALAPAPSVISALVAGPVWDALEDDGPAALWTDDRSSVFGVMRW